jgi:hypothetical protein
LLQINNEIEFFINTNNILNRYTILAVPNRNTVILDIPFSSIKKIFDNDILSLEEFTRIWTEEMKLRNIIK